jgi:serine/threonine protein phosphatase PrpC
VRKGIKREECQDSAAVFTCEDFLAAGVFDGYAGLGGTLVSEGVANHLVEVCLEKSKTLAKDLDAKALLLDAAGRLADDTFPGNLGTFYGSTGMVALVLPDGTFSLAAIADSAVYIVGQRSVKRMLNYDTVLTHDLSYAPAIGMDLDQYSRCRNYVMNTIERSGASNCHVETGTGTLRKGESIVLVSDGITKNLGIIVQKEKSRMVAKDVGGCRDLRRIITGKRYDIANTIMGEISRRRENNCEKKEQARIVVSENELLVLQDDDLSIVTISLKTPK